MASLRPFVGFATRKRLVCLAIAGFALPMGCGPATGHDGEYWTHATLEQASENAGGAGGASVGSGSGGAMAATTADTSSATTGGSTGPGYAQLDFTTVTFHGEHAPKNIGAVWVEDQNGGFVKTLELWAAKRKAHLVKWNAESGGNVVDAVTGATKQNHIAHQSHWDMTAANGSVVPDGNYSILVEFTESDSAKSSQPKGPWISVPLVKGGDAVDQALPDAANFVGQHLVYQP